MKTMVIEKFGATHAYLESGRAQGKVVLINDLHE